VRRFTVEETTHQAHRDLVDEAIYLRGRIIAAYAQVEFLLADLISKLEDRFAYRIESRIKGVRKIADMPRYEAYWYDLHRLADELLIYEELRHFVAHGYMRAESAERKVIALSYFDIRGRARASMRYCKVRTISPALSRRSRTSDRM
jgi:hypothetical protein